DCALASPGESIYQRDVTSKRDRTADRRRSSFVARLCTNGLCWPPRARRTRGVVLSSAFQRSRAYLDLYFVAPLSCLLVTSCEACTSRLRLYPRIQYSFFFVCFVHVPSVCALEVLRS